MSFEEFIKRGLVKRTSKDLALIKSLIIFSERDHEFLKKIKIDDLSARNVMTGYYDILRSILEAISSLEGYKIYSHEAFTEFLKLKDESIASQKFDRLRRVRNGIRYYGKSIKPEEVKENVLEIMQLVKHLKAKYLNKL
jgi:pyoverdine/dityrosine biosynthesis protein Dit1